MMSVNKVRILIALVIFLIIFFFYYYLSSKPKMDTNQGHHPSILQLGKQHKLPHKEIPLPSYYVSLEQNLCFNPSYTPKGSTLPCPTDSIVTVESGGRLANQIFEYASVWAVSRKTNLKPFIPRCIHNRMEGLFEYLSIPNLQQIDSCPFNRSTFMITRAYSISIAQNENLLMPKYTTHIRLVLEFYKDIRKEFVYRKDLQDRAQVVLHQARKRRPFYSNITFVGIHVRQTDYIKYLKNVYGGTPATKDYFYKAMKYFEEKYKTVVFVVTSDNIKWCLENLNVGSQVFFTSGRNSPELDLVILSLCNHTIIDYGTYGVWAAVYAGGETVFYNETKYTFTQQIKDILPNWKSV